MISSWHVVGGDRAESSEDDHIGDRKAAIVRVHARFFETFGRVGKRPLGRVYGPLEAK
jgi:hypothetical protein